MDCGCEVFFTHTVAISTLLQRKTQAHQSKGAYWFSVLRDVYFFLTVLPHILPAPNCTRLVADVPCPVCFCCLCGLHSICLDRLSDRSPRSEPRILQLSFTHTNFAGSSGSSRSPRKLNNGIVLSLSENGRAHTKVFLSRTQHKYSSITAA
jgi:hypothetical protein